MNPQSLHALIVDRHAGELSPEAVELLELHLAQNSDARTEAERIVQALDVTRDAVVRHPELARVVPAAKPVVLQPARRTSVMPWLARAAAIALLASLAGAGGFLIGRAGSRGEVAKDHSTSPVIIAQVTPRKESPWAQYRMSFDPAGEGVQVVRVDTASVGGKSIR